MAKEFFMLLTQHILSPDFGMFVEDEGSHLSWFRDGVGHMTSGVGYMTPWVGHMSPGWSTWHQEWHMTPGGM